MKNKSDAGTRSHSESPPFGRTRPVASFREMGSHFLAFRTKCFGGRASPYRFVAREAVSLEENCERDLESGTSNEEFVGLVRFRGGRE